MPAHRADDQPGSAYRPTDQGELTTFTARLPRWPVLVRLWGRDPLVRTTDRVEALVLAVAGVLSLLAVTVAGAVGTTVYDSRSQVYAEQADSRSAVIATITDVPVYRDGPPIGAVTMPARWSLGGIDHTGAVAAPSTAEIGDTVDIWVDNDGTQVTAPTSTTRAALEAVTIALLVVVGVAGTASVLFTFTRSACNRIRFARWQYGLDSLVDHGNGNTNHRRKTP